jgi:hypothetical protein
MPDIAEYHLRSTGIDLEGVGARPLGLAERGDDGNG